MTSPAKKHVAKTRAAKAQRVTTRRRPAGARARRAVEVAARLAEEYPGEAAELCALNHTNAFELLIATILSAQCTDERVNEVTPDLFREYPTPADLAAADPGRVEDLIRSTGFFRAKTRSLIGMADAVATRFGGEVPTEMEDLVTLPGVGRKTANVIRSVGFNLPGLPVDTHVSRISRRLDLTTSTDAVRAEAELCALLPEASWGPLSLRLILHGRAVCRARTPQCSLCVLAEVCPSANIFRKNLPPTRVGRRREAVS